MMENLRSWLSQAYRGILKSTDESQLTGQVRESHPQMSSRRSRKVASRMIALCLLAGIVVTIGYRQLHGYFERAEETLTLELRDWGSISYEHATSRDSYANGLSVHTDGALSVIYGCSGEGVERSFALVLREDDTRHGRVSVYDLNGKQPFTIGTDTKPPTVQVTELGANLNVIAYASSAEPTGSYDADNATVVLTGVGGECDSPEYDFPTAAIASEGGGLNTLWTEDDAEGEVAKTEGRGSTLITVRSHRTGNQEYEPTEPSFLNRKRTLTAASRTFYVVFSRPAWLRVGSAESFLAAPSLVVVEDLYLHAATLSGGDTFGAVVGKQDDYAVEGLVDGTWYADETLGHIQLGASGRELMGLEELAIGSGFGSFEARIDEQGSFILVKGHSSDVKVNREQLVESDWEKLSSESKTAIVLATIGAGATIARQLYGHRRRLVRWLMASEEPPPLPTTGSQAVSLEQGDLLSAVPLDSVLSEPADDFPNQHGSV